MSTILVNHKVRRKENESSSSSTTAETLIARGMGSNYEKDKEDVGKSIIGNHG